MKQAKTIKKSSASQHLTKHSRQEKLTAYLLMKRHMEINSHTRRELMDDATADEASGSKME
jgi:hypothetical protein